MRTAMQYNKAYVAALGTLVTGLLLWADTRYNLNLGPELITVAGVVATGFFTWLIPNIQKAIKAGGE